MSKVKTSPPATPTDERPSDEISGERMRPTGDAERYLRTDFLRSLAHALRSPLAVVHAGTSQLSTRESEEDRHLSAMMMRNLQRALNVTRQLEWVAELEAKQVELDLSNFDVRLMVSEAAATLDMSKLELSIDAPSDLPRARVDRGLILRALAAVLDNARRFARQRVQVSLSRTDAGIEIVVDDDGLGIAPDRLDGLYDRFTSARARGADSDLALGLSIARDYVALHGGSLWHERRSDEGARCRIVLPAA